MRSLITFYNLNQNYNQIASKMNIEKQAFKLGEMLIDTKQIFWKMQYCFALIPIVQLLDGRTVRWLFRCTLDHKKKSIIIQSAWTRWSLWHESCNKICIKITWKLLWFGVKHNSYSKCISRVSNQTLDGPYNS